MTDFGAYKGMFKTLEAESLMPPDTRLSFLESADKIIQLKTVNTETGITRSIDLRLAVVKPAHCMMPTKEDVNIYEFINSPGILYRALKGIEGTIAVDIETNGTQAADSDVRIVGIGIASSTKIMYFDFETNIKECNEAILGWLRDYEGAIVGHNVFFDGTFLLRDTGKWLNWKYDTYGMYRQLANEGYPGQSYGLKTAQLQLLNWDAKGDVELDEYLVKEGHVSDIKKEKKDGYYLGKPMKGEARYYKPKKSEMYRAPAKILGYYCGLDAASTLMLLEDVFLPSIKGQAYEEVFLDYHELFMKNVELLGNQQLTGITIQKEPLEAYKLILEEEIVAAELTFRNHEKVNPFAEELNRRAVDAIQEKEPEQYKKLRIPSEPDKEKKDGSISKSWTNWRARMDEIEKNGPEVSKNWESWAERLEEAKHKEHFNINSPTQLQELFYEYLGLKVLVTTTSGDPSTGVQALPGFGEVGKLLKECRDKEKELGYVKACLEHLFEDDEGNYRIHPQFRAPGTLTCRLAGSGGLNLQQIPKSRRYLECWRPVEGKAWVDCDHTSLEQVVMAELTRDSSLWKIYGPDAKFNDIYLFNGSQLPVIGPKILAAGYDPDNPTEVDIAKTKKECKKERGISKVITLGSSYGMGAKKLKMNLGLQGIDITEKQAYAMHGSYWDLYSGVKDYEAFLLEELERNNGYVINGIGRPVCCAADYTKDIVNRVVQSTGHDIHMLYVRIVNTLLNDEGIEHDGIVWDFHDQTILECNVEDVERVKYILGTKAYEVLNKELGGEIKLAGDPQIIQTMADAKCG